MKRMMSRIHIDGVVSVGSGDTQPCWDDTVSHSLSKFFLPFCDSLPPSPPGFYTQRWECTVSFGYICAIFNLLSYLLLLHCTNIILYSNYHISTLCPAIGDGSRVGDSNQRRGHLGSDVRRMLRDIGTTECGKQLPFQ